MISGLVLANGWDENMDVTEIIISTPDESEYVVKPNARGQMLRQYCNSEVRAWGSIHRHGGTRIIDIRKVEIMNDDEADPLHTDHLSA